MRSNLNVSQQYEEVDSAATAKLQMKAQTRKGARRTCENGNGRDDITPILL